MSAVDDKFDSEADETILACLNVDKPRSFFLYAGAGSGQDSAPLAAALPAAQALARRVSLAEALKVQE